MNFKRILSILSPEPLIGALEITDSDLKFIQIKKDVPSMASLKLPPEAFKDGKIKDRGVFLDNLAKFHSQLAGRSKKKIYAIVNIPDDNVYAQLFNLPAVAEQNLEEAVRLNLQMISPIDFESVYSDWQIVNKNGSQFEVLGAFVQREIIDEIDGCLASSNFVAAAFEFHGLALARLAVEDGAVIDIKEPFILFCVQAHGLSFHLVKNGNLYFNHLVSWQSIYGDQRQVSLDIFRKLVAEEFKKILSFYSSRWGGGINNVYLITPGLEKEIIQIVSQNFSIKAQSLPLKKFKDVSSSWFAVLGSALRGLVPRSRDAIISLASVGTEKKFKEQRIIRFVKIWRNIVLTTLIVMLIIFLEADIFLLKLSDSLKNQLSALTINQQDKIVDLKKLQEQVKNLNKKIDLAETAYGERLKWSSFLAKIKDLASDKIIFNRIFIQSLDMPVLINAQAPDEQTALDFKNKLSVEPNIDGIDLPIDKISKAVKGVDFTISFRVKKLE
ncbi:MAG: Cell division protein FtsA [Candidatus Curtissbacteria bacterium GW2011_GWA1_40_24]|uniref:Cell division protein FtsA n=2 Tax=Patescibacteria group TaxID=1783273 RepID=A0A0G0UZA4_9BACT|nr:MAG: Cell division protein FtsA [Candidatus Curtissbacteria bacterium GW2011_GWA1_40_24]KKR89002.1 MAG: Cell division protein FtsA [Candidatus Wolfebacteria bacterium GW2011_GWB1_41_12]